MIHIRNSKERGRADFGWLDSRHTFSFGNYHDPDHMGFRSLRVINDDRVRPGAGFGEHPHQDMEIVSYVLSGALAHRDSMGNGSVLSAGDVQRMSAGAGVRHSEMNPSLEEPTRFLQIWILPEQEGLEPSYEEIHLSEDDKRGRLVRVASGSGVDGAMKIHQDVEFFTSIVDAGDSVKHSLTPGRYAWIQVARGSVAVNGVDLEEGDGAAVSDETEVRIDGRDSAEVLLFDLN
jgi:redox-sensitive bicupin YhaK (pirin superfamily)